MRSNIKPLILRPATLRAYDRGRGARTIPLVTRAGGAHSFINGITIFDPGARVPFHRHNCDESIMIIEGRAIADIDGVAHELDAYDTTFLPAGVPHRFRNASQTEPMRMLWIYGSVDATRTLIESGETRAIDSEHGGSKEHDK